MDQRIVAQNGNGKNFAPATNFCGDTLLCPACGGNYLHHFEIMVYDRAEDDPQTLKISIRHHTLTSQVVTSEDCGNPSGRRHGLTIRFWCEGCDANLLLCVSQHKGTTFFEWMEQ